MNGNAKLVKENFKVMIIIQCIVKNVKKTNAFSVMKDKNLVLKNMNLNL